MKYASRKYVDLILEVSSKWANWDPPHPIKIGDYGTIDKETGRFEKDGNVYEDPETSLLCASHQPELLPPDEKIVITSETDEDHGFSFGPEVNIPGIAETSIKGRWKFKTGKTGALLIMAQPRSSIIVGTTLLQKLVDLPALKDKCLVTETVACHAYSLYLSSKSEDAVSLALVATTPLPVAPLVSAGGEIGGSWWSQTGAGLYPLFMIKRIRKKSMIRYRGAPENDLWEDVEKPWCDLNEDGEDEEYQDTEQL
ncbi:hypothetical protein B0H13DRAFT_2035647 [Mycena leptocephala]|nr:hypothetical protein B0H13DRAFT_2035647 [Mycena leptocephala]